MRKILITLFILAFSQNILGQIDLKIGDKIKRKVENKVNQKVDQGIDKGLDKSEDGIKKETKSDGKTKDAKSTEDTKANNVDKDSDKSATVSSASLKSYGKFDFIPGEKILVSDDFSNDAIGDFPLLWNTNSTGELVNVEGQTGKWLSLSKDGVFIPEFIIALPDNFTFEFELMCNETFSYYSTPISVNICKLSEAKVAFQAWKDYGLQEKRDGVQLNFHPTSAGSKDGVASYTAYDNGAEVMKNSASNSQFYFKNKNHVKISIWRQKLRLRVYMNEEKVWDLPRAFTAGTTYNTICFSIGGFNSTDDRYLISNFKLAVGAPDTRNKLLTEGKFSTSGILFDIGSDHIRPDSYGVLKDIATVLQENPMLKVKILGHTDSDGEDAANLELSKRRAEAVRNSLSTEFSIDKSRMTSDGKGEREPLVDNSKPEGKAQNRRVEFIKL